MSFHGRKTNEPVKSIRVRKAMILLVSFLELSKTTFLKKMQVFNL